MSLVCVTMNQSVLIILAIVACASATSVAPVRWCTVSNAEQKKCEALSVAVSDDFYSFANSHTTVQCVQRGNHDECMQLLDSNEADIVALDANEIFLAGRYHSLLPIMKNVYKGDEADYQAVAVVKRGNLTQYSHMRDLAGTTACFSSVASMAGWILPIARLMESGVMKVEDCNNHVKSAAAFFKEGCAVNILSDKHNPLGDNTQALCAACGSELPGQHCTSQDKYAGYRGALHCLMDKGDVAFLKHSTVAEAVADTNDPFPYTVADFELLCMDGRRAPLSEFRTCNWGSVPADALVTSSAKTVKSRQLLQNFMETVVQLYGTRDPVKPNKFHLFESVPKYGNSYDALLSDDTISLRRVSLSDQNFQNYLPPEMLSHINTVRSCPVANMTFCVTSRVELAKCLRMKLALSAQLLKPEVKCLNGGSAYECMVSIERKDADVAVMEAGDIYSGGLQFNLVPFIAERYNLATTHYYVVAVSKEDDMETDVLYLRGRRTCHPAMNHGGGWVMPLDYLLNNGFIRSYGCNSLRAASQYFSKSCVPGALSPVYKQSYEDSYHLNLCHLCHGTGSSYCARDHTEPYFGFTGAFQCLVEGGGDVAFLKHTTVSENTDGKRRDWWARNQLTADYQLLCRDGTRAPTTDYLKCNMGKIRSNAVVTRGGYDYNATEIMAYTNLFLYAQQYFGRDSEDEWDFQMFHSDGQYADIIFQDATQQLVPLAPEQHHYHAYLGKEFLNAKYRTDCTAGSRSTTVSSAVLVALCVLLPLIS